MTQKHHVRKLPIYRDVGGHGHVDDDGDGDHDSVGDTSITRESLFCLTSRS